MRTGLTIGTKLMGAVAGLIALTIILSYVSLTSIGAFERQFDNAVDRTVAKLILADSITAANLEMLLAQRGVILDTFTKDTGQVGTKLPPRTRQPAAAGSRPFFSG